MAQERSFQQQLVAQRDYLIRFARLRLRECLDVNWFGNRRNAA